MTQDNRETGLVTYFSVAHGTGKLTAQNGEDLWFYGSLGLERLGEGMKVSYERGSDGQGGECALNLVII
jgi:cold shock CspA family protein